MNHQLEGILKLIQQSELLNTADKKNVLQAMTQIEDELQQKNRDLEIEAALERVRARTMAMQKSDELRETSLVLFQQLKELGEPAEQLTIGIVKEEENVVEVSATLQGIKLLQSFRHDADEPFVMNKMFKAWKANQKTLVIEQEWEELQEYNQYRNKLVGSEMFPVNLKPGDRRLLYVAFFSKGTLALSSNEPRPKETLQLLERFASVLDLTYTRFYDLQKAESQTREAQIEVSLERVRSKTMSMHNSQDVADTVVTMFDEWAKLGIKTFRCGIGILENTKQEDTKQMEVWTARPGADEKVALAFGRINMAIHPLLQGAYNGWKNNEESFTYELKGDDIRKYFTAINNHVDYPVKYELSNLPSKIYHKDFYFPEGTLFVFSLEELSAETSKVLKRFAGVLGQTYRRFLDLQKAESQAREAHIEAALERVRSKAMAMHKSDDLHDAVETVFDELDKLSLGMMRCGIGIFSKEKRSAEVWSTTVAEEGLIVQVSGGESMDTHPLLKGDFDAWLKQEDFSYVLEGEDMSEYYRSGMDSNFQLPESQIMVEHAKDLKHYYYATSFESGMLFAFRETDFTEEAKTVMKRFAGVFNLTYKRFLDIQKAEAQTREAKIEGALERVRSKAMAMHKSDDLNDAVAIVFQELDKLKLGMLRCGIGILNKEKRSADVWTTTVAEEGHIAQVMGDESIDIHPLLLGAFDAWEHQKDFSYLLEGEDLNKYYNAVSKVNFKLPDSQSITAPVAGLKQYYYVTPFQSGNLYTFREAPFSEEAKAVMTRFAGVFNLTYKRFLDIQKAEEHAKQSEVQKRLIEEKHREITDNISYALRIQSAILPSEKLVKEFLPDSFVLYLPKDVVAGDFYWMIRVKDVILFAVCDCTGHGVSGAMVSVICNNALNGAVRECNLTQPAAILDKVVELVEENFTQSENQIQDGMDASLCAWFPLENKLQWAGANNPLWIVRNNELLEYKPDKQPIGKYENRKPFTNHEITLQQGDSIYIFSDGYQDQFGGENGKKLTKKGLRNILLSVQEKNMEAQYEALLNQHNQWKGKEEQVDDICILGVKI